LPTGINNRINYYLLTLHYYLRKSFLVTRYCTERARVLYCGLLKSYMRKLLILSLLLSFAFTSVAQQFTRIKECVIQNGMLKDVELDYDPNTGDRSIVINGVRKKLEDVYPKTGPEYAKGQSWYVNNDSIIFNGKPFKKYGLPRVLGLTEISKHSTYKGVRVYTEVGLTGIVEVIYMPVQRGCEFQPYQISCGGSVQIEKVNGTSTTMQFKAKATGLTGSIDYEWKSNNVFVVNGQGTPIVTVDITNIYDGDKISMGVIATDAKKCPISDLEVVYVSKPGSQPKWNAKDRKEFIDECAIATKFPEAQGKAYCTCMLDKIEKKYPTPTRFEKEYTKEVLEVWAKECLSKIN